MQLKSQGWGWGIPPATMKVIPSYLHYKNGRKIEPQKIPGCLLSCLLVVCTWKLEILVTALNCSFFSLNCLKLEKKHNC